MLQNYKHVPQLLVHDVLGGYLLEKQWRLSYYLPNTVLLQQDAPGDAGLLNLNQLILTITITDRGFSPLNRFIAGKRRSSRNWIKKRASNLSSGFFNNQLARSPSLEMAQIAE